MEHRRNLFRAVAGKCHRPRIDHHDHTELLRFSEKPHHRRIADFQLSVELVQPPHLKLHNSDPAAVPFLELRLAFPANFHTHSPGDAAGIPFYGVQRRFRHAALKSCHQYGLFHAVLLHHFHQGSGLKRRVRHIGRQPSPVPQRRAQHSVGVVPVLGNRINPPRLTFGNQMHMSVYPPSMHV